MPTDAAYICGYWFIETTFTGLNFFKVDVNTTLISYMFFERVLGRAKKFYEQTQVQSTEKPQSTEYKLTVNSTGAIQNIPIYRV